MPSDGSGSAVYMDHAHGRPVRKEAMAEMQSVMERIHGNPSSLHASGLAASRLLESLRKRLAAVVNCLPEEIVFTSGSTESNNLAVSGFLAASPKSRGIALTCVEHESIYDTAMRAKEGGIAVHVLKVDGDGLLVPGQIAALEEGVGLACVQAASNETGTVQDMEAVGKETRAKKIRLHCDFSAALGMIHLDFKNHPADTVTLDSNVAGGPVGTGVLIVRKGTKVKALFGGGAQERGRRPGFPDVASIAGFVKAAEMAAREMDAENKRLTAIRDGIIRRATGEIKRCFLDGHPVKRLPNNVHLRFDFIEGEALILNLDNAGIACATGSACSSHSLEPSRTLVSMGIPPERAHGSLQLTLGPLTRESDADTLMKALPGVVQMLRDMSPLGEGYETPAGACAADDHDHDHVHESD